MITNATTETSNTLWARIAKRPFDLVAALLLVVILSPLLLLAALLTKLTSSGPILFIQERAGQAGCRFALLKFRTMRAARTPNPTEVVPLDHADITPVGRILRRFKIDELPQLFNVLAGHLSLVGPRPTLPEQVAAYDEFRRQRLAIRPGLTGLAQVNGNTSMPWDERILFDIAYVRRCRLSLDLAILLRTVVVVLAGEGRTTRPFASTPYAQWVTPPEGYPTTGT